MPRWSHDRILFDIEDRGVLVHCAISKAAIQDSSEKRLNLPEQILRQFMDIRDHVTAVAIRKSRKMAPAQGLLCVWSSDLDDDPAPAAPAVSRAAAG
ncbi:DUF1488 family protein [Pararoseomonas indoligenes]|uniref:DUF1488 family protein n=1 Tax=Roseomonas indoligenes TaxID=2820811 RepID=A0A940N2Z6_9PROT|nr:DUF1488 family protein [Pararoseomonas indoligenes]